MKLKKIFNLNNILLLLLAIYFVFCISYDREIRYFSFIPWTIIIFILFLFIQKFLDKIKFKSSKKIRLIEFAIYTYIIVIAIVFSIANNNCYPTDFTGIWNVLARGIYSDWHPFLYTIIFVKLPSIFYYSFYSCKIFQGFYIYVCLMYLCYFLRKYFLNIGTTIIILLLIVLNPSFLVMTSSLLKDVPFSYTILVGTMFLIEIVITKGEWISKTKNKVLFIIMCFFMVYIRHNGIANFLLMMILLIIFYKKYRKFYVSFFIIFITARVIITGPIYNFLNVKPNIGTAEMLGVPLNQIRYIEEHGKGFKKEYQDKIYSIFKKECFNGNYSKYMYFNEIKFNCPDNLKKLKSISLDVVRIWLDLAVKNPKLSLKNYLAITSIYWRIDHYKSFYCFQYNSRENNNGVYYYTNFIFKTPLKFLFIDLGSALFLILFSIYLIIRKGIDGIRRFIPYILVISNVIIVSCLVTGDEMRFAYPSITCTYPLIVYALYNNQIKKD